LKQSKPPTKIRQHQLRKEAVPLSKEEPRGPRGTRKAEGILFSPCSPCSPWLRSANWTSGMGEVFTPTFPPGGRPRRGAWQTS
jgi:hypothetical protein